MGCRLSHADLAELYRSVARLADAGVPLEPALRSQATAAGSAATRALALAFAEVLQRGEPLSAALARMPAPSIPPHHAGVVAAAEQSGRLGAALATLARELDENRAAERELLQRCAYPLFVFHLAAFAPLAGELIQHPAAALAQLLAIVVPVDALLAFAYAKRRSPGLAGVFEVLPFTRGAAVSGAYASFFGALHSLYESGVPLPRAAREALHAVAPPRLHAALERAIAPLERSEPFRSALASFPGVSESDRLVLLAAEPAGELGAAFRQCAAMHAERRATLVRRIARGAAAALYAAIVVFAVVQIVGFYSSYLGRFSQR